MEIFLVVGIVKEMLIRGIDGERISNTKKRLRPQAIIIVKNNDR